MPLKRTCPVVERNEGVPLWKTEVGVLTETPLKMTDGGETEFLLFPTCWTMTPASRAPE